MDAELIKRIEHFLVLSNLKGYDINHDYDYDLIDNITQVEHFLNAKKDITLDKCLHIAFMANDMTITAEDMENYWDDIRAREEEEERRLEKIEKVRLEKEWNETPELVNLLTVNNFKHTTGPFKNSKYFEFTKFVKNIPVVVKCRMGNSEYGNNWIWYNWVDPKTKKTIRHKFKYSYSSSIPSWIPSWKTYWTTPTEIRCLIFAYAMTSSWKGLGRTLVKMR